MRHSMQLDVESRVSGDLIVCYFDFLKQRRASPLTQWRDKRSRLEQRLSICCYFCDA